MQFESTLDRLYRRASRIQWLVAFASFCRLALAVGFIAPGLTKVFGYRFADWGTAATAGYYFEAIYQTGVYYRFIGASQVLAGTFLLFRRTSPLGAVFYFPIILNIFALTNSMGFSEFRFTVLDTALMTLACLFLLCWYYPLWKRLVFVDADPLPPPPHASGNRPIVVAWWLAATGGVGVTSFMRGLIRPGMLPTLSLILLASSFLILGVELVRRRITPRAVA